MAQIGTTATGQVVSVLRAQVEIIQGKELPMAKSKQEVCREAGWAFLESFFAGEANRLETEMRGLQQLIDSELTKAAAR